MSTIRQIQDRYIHAVETTRDERLSEASRARAAEDMIEARHELDAALVRAVEPEGVSPERAARAAFATPGPSEADLRACLDRENPRHLLNLTESRANEEWWSDTSSTVKAGYTVPTSVLNRVIYHINAESGVFGPAYKFNTSTGEDVTVPILATDATANLTAEKTASTVTNPVFASETLASYRLDGHFILSDELMRDSAVDVQRVVGDAAGRALATKLASYLATGTGSSEPEGVTVGAAAGVTAAVDSITLDEVKELFYSVLPSARRNGVFVGSSDCTLALAQMKDDSANYVWSPQVAGAESDYLFGKPYYEDAAFPSMATGTVPLIFGDLSNYYWVRMVTRGQNGGGIQLDFSQDVGFTSFVTYARWAIWCDARVMGTGGEIKKLTMG